MAETAVARYLARPPFYGKSAIGDRLVVKQLCGPTAIFDNSYKMWGTKCEDALRHLVASKKWWPVGIEHDQHAPLMRAADDQRTKAEAAWVAEQARKRAAAAEALREAEAKHKSWLSGLKAPTSKRKANEKMARGATATATATVGQGATPRTKNDVCGVCATASEVAECKRLGFSEDAIAKSNACDELGPRGTLSNEGRVLRWCSVLTTGARHHLYHGTDDFEDFYYGIEDSCYDGVHGFAAFRDEDRIAKLSEAAHRKFAKRLAELCKETEGGNGTVNGRYLGGW